MKFKIIAIIAVVLVMLLATVAYLATKENDNTGSETLTEQVQP